MSRDKNFLESVSVSMDSEEYKELRSALWRLFRDEAQYSNTESRKAAIMAAEALMHLETLKPQQ